jgi:small subunit ribosomal protein S17
MPKRILKGMVVAKKNQKTLAVLVTRRFIHPVFKKTVNRSKKYQVHNEDGQYKVGDQIRIIESRPYSKTKCFEVLKD